MGQNDKWLDVCLKNVIIFLGALAALNYKTEAIWAVLQDLTSEAKTWSKRTLAKAWVCLADYQTVENKVVELTGHAHHLVRVGHESPGFSFGLSGALEKGMLRSFIRFITSPRVAMRQVARATRAFNVNKTFRFVVDEPDRCVFEVEYLPGPDGKKRSPEDDLRSLLFYIRGILESLVPIWSWSLSRQPKKTVWYLTVNVRPEAVVSKENPAASFGYRDGWFYIDGIRHGKIVHLVRDQKNGAYLGEYRDAPAVGTLPAVLITETYKTACQKTGQPFPILRQGEIYRYTVEIPTHIRIVWKTNRFFRLVERIPGILKRLETGLGAEERMAAAEIALAAEAAAKRVLYDIVVENSPTRAVAEALVNRTFKPNRLPTLALLLDIVGFTRLGQNLGQDAIAESVVSMFEKLETVARQYGFWPYKRMGDALLLIYAEWPLAEDEKRPYIVLREAALAMVKCAGELHHIADGENHKLRIGVASGDVVWSNQAPPDARGVTFEGLGSALNEAARLECFGAKGGQTAASTAFVKLTSGETKIPSEELGTTVGRFQCIGAVKEKAEQTIVVWLAVTPPLTPSRTGLTATTVAVRRRQGGGQSN